MDFKACKNCEHLHQMISGDRVKNVCLRTGSIEQQSIPIEAVCHCPGFKDFGVSLWEVRDVGDCYVVVREKQFGGLKELTSRDSITNAAEWKYFFSRNAAELTAASLNQEVYVRMIQRGIEKRRTDGYEK
ncbi:hypothetical protein [Acidaminococcus timonensis]|uniref:hypothetical protein n=1 Tax=Acidaminococcus timonensis TaxID=1871002 RepID=UPI0029438157|nr:hypothetical protein [Acidaminococcus timonensis]